MIKDTEKNQTFADRLGTFSSADALQIGDGPSTDYQELVFEVDEFSRKLGSGRRLILLEFSTSLESVVAYLAALRNRNPVILADPSNRQVNEELATRFDVSAIVSSDGIIYRRQPGKYLIHPDLSVMLSTSGSTGSSRFVKLSYRNLESNAASISQYLQLGSEDVGGLTLPLYYSYGLSVLNSHIYSGAKSSATGVPQGSPAYLEWIVHSGCTNLSGVPYSYEIFERLKFRQTRFPALKFMTAAGGKLHPLLVRKYADYLEENGGEFFVMYGQTEATARIAYLPANEAHSHPDCLGIAIPGGELYLMDENGKRIERANTEGELVYKGPNVMMGYADSFADLASGHEVEELHTGDVAELTKSGFFRIAGRKSRFSKIAGFRISHDDIEAKLHNAGFQAVVTGTDDYLVVGLTGSTCTEDVARHILKISKLLPSQLTILSLGEIPRLTSGKTDYQALRIRAESQPASAGAQVTTNPVLTAFSRAFWPREINRTDSFSSLGGDSLTYVQLSMDLEKCMDEIPPGWENMTIDEITRQDARQTTWISVDHTIYIRALAILLVVLHHLSDWGFKGGAAVLMVMVGYSTARFQSRSLFDGHVKNIARPLARNLFLYYIVLSGWLIWEQIFSVPHLLLASNIIATPYEPIAYNAYWFVEAYAQIILCFILLFSMPVARRQISRHPFAFGLTALAASLIIMLVWRTTWNQSWNACAQGPCNPVSEVAYMATIGWCLYFANTAFLRNATIALATGIMVVLGYEYPVRLIIYISTFILLAWSVRLPLPRAVANVVSSIAAYSYAIYLLHLVPFVILGHYGIWTWGMLPVTLGIGFSYFIMMVARTILALKTPLLPGSRK
jgi:acyl-coenzyme A synthetase/AMP-(fatty) acid ligase